MKNLLVVLILCFASPNAALTAQVRELNAENSRDTVSFLGKRKNIIWGRTIATENLGDMWYTYYYPIFFRSKMNGQTRRVGLFGERIKPYFDNNELAMSYFNDYRLKKSLSYVSLPASIGCLFGWAYFAAERRVLYDDSPFKSFVRPVPLTFLVGYFALFYTGMYINTDADKDLFAAVQVAKGKTPQRLKHKPKAQLGIGSSSQSILSLQVSF